MQSKTVRHTLYKYLQSLKTSKESWQSIFLNFIIDLPELQELLIKIKYNSILIIIDKLIKYIYFLKKQPIRLFDIYFLTDNYWEPWPIR